MLFEDRDVYSIRDRDLQDLKVGFPRSRARRRMRPLISSATVQDAPNTQCCARRERTRRCGDVPASSPLASSALGKLRDTCGNCPSLARLVLPCGGTPAAILYIRCGQLRIRSDDGRDIGKDIL
jgi:hypothetical protein